MTFGKWFAEWLEVYKRPYLKSSSFERIEYLTGYIPADFSQKKLKKITALDLDRLFSSIEYGRTRKYLYTVLSESFKKAYCLGLTKKNVFSKIEPVKHKPKVGKALSKAELDRFIYSIRDSKYCNLFLFYLYTGCRRSEALSILWTDIDFEFKQVRIRGTKTEGSDRIIFLLPECIEILEKQKSVSGDNVRVFPYDKTNVTHAFKKYCPGYKLHDLRHTFITRCAESGINIKVAQKMAGHSDITTTLKVYTHVTTEFERQEFNKFSIK